MLTLNNLSYYISGKSIIENASMQLADNQRAGLIGRNGCGKSTLFKLILGKLQSDGGEINLSRGMRIVTVAQEVPSDERTPIEFLLDSDLERAELFKELESSDDPDRLGEIYDRLYQIDAYSAEARAATILKGLGFSEEQQNKPLSGFSGGFRMRVALAAALFRTPDLLLLDEPTNHLDLESVLWLQEFLKKYPHSMLIVSHDRDFLNEVVDYIVHLQKGKLTSYKGNYDAYETRYRLQLEANMSFNKKLEAQKQHMQKFVDRFKAKASKAKQAQSRMKAIAKLVPISLLIDEAAIKLSFPAPEKLASPIMSFDKASLGYDGKAVLKNCSGNIAPDDRIALLGSNGNGKSTFAKMLAGQLKPLSGQFYASDKLRVGYFTQHQFDNLDLESTAYLHIKELLPHLSESAARAHLGQFAFNKDKADLKVESLSGGEKARLVFAMITAMKPNILILDEPTNHLDMDMRDSLIMAINEFEGAVILITHDLHIINHIADTLLLVHNNTVKPYSGTVDDYRRELGFK